MNNNVAKLRTRPEHAYNFPFSVPGNYTFDNAKIEISGEVGITPYAWYHLNEFSGANAPDSSENGYDGTCINMEDADWVAGKLNNCLQFDGSNESINLGDIANFEKTDSFTLEVWFSTTQNTQGAIISREIPTGSILNGYDLYINAGKITFLLISDVSTNDYFGKTTNATFNDGNCHHLVLTYDGSNNVNGIIIYIDGSPVSSESVGSASITGSILNTADCSIGSTDNVNRFFNGKIDEVVIYDDEMNASIVSSRYNAGAGTEAEITGSGIVRLKEIFIPIPSYAWWHLNEASGSNAVDSSENGRNGTLVNMEDGDWIAGKLDNCLTFDGTNEYIDCGDIAGFERTDSFSLECWFKTSANARVIISKMINNPPWTGYLIYMHPSGKIRIQLAGTNSDLILMDTYNEYDDNSWYHIIVTYDGSSDASGVNVYINGSLVAVTIVFNELTTSILTSVNFNIGARVGNVNYAGLIDEVVIYDRELSSSEVSTRYNSGNGTESMPLEGVYGTGDPDIYPNTGKTFTTPLEGFTEISTKPSGAEIKYQVSSDDGATWKWWNGATWVAITGAQTNSWYYTNESNLASVVHTNIGSLAGSGTFKFRAFLHSDTGLTRPLLDNIYIAESVVYPTDSPEISMNNDIQPTKVSNYLTINEGVTKPANTDIKYQYSIDGGSFWNGTWLTETELETAVQGISCIGDGSDKIRFKFQLSTTDIIKTPEIDNLNITSWAGYKTSGSYTSTRSHYAHAAHWGEVRYNITTPTNTTVIVLGKFTYLITDTLGEFSELENNDFVGETSHELTWKVEFTTDGISTPSLDYLEIDFRGEQYYIAYLEETLSKGSQERQDIREELQTLKTVLDNTLATATQERQTIVNALLNMDTGARGEREDLLKILEKIHRRI